MTCIAFHNRGDLLGNLLGKGDSRGADLACRCEVPTSINVILSNSIIIVLSRSRADLPAKSSTSTHTEKKKKERGGGIVIIHRPVNFQVGSWRQRPTSRSNDCYPPFRILRTYPPLPDRIVHSSVLHILAS